MHRKDVETRRHTVSVEIKTLIKQCLPETLTHSLDMAEKMKMALLLSTLGLFVVEEERKKKRLKMKGKPLQIDQS